MMNSELKNNEQGNSWVDASIYNKKPAIATKKTVLADVQNDKRVVRNYRESSIFMNGGPTADKVKVSGTKRLTTESPTSHPWPPLPDHTATKEHLVYTTKKSEFVPGNKKTENTDRNMSSPPLKRFCSMEQETPQKQSRAVENNTHQFSSPGNGAESAETVCLNDTSKVALPSDCKRVEDQKICQNWEERYVNLQNYLKICDSESTHKKHIQNLRHLSPAELSMYAVELEKRAIQLTIEEGKEFQRMKALKIFEKSAGSINASQKSEPSLSKK